ncbi:MAG: 3'-5' exonuclease [Muribaculaceae bacterium]|nr:3'-5' exonuclease [Muribaculaceae bacterium]
MELKLKNPLVFFDIETTGLNITSDRIVEISYIKVMPNGQEETRCFRVNPERPIPAESIAVHHITDEDVKDCPTFKQMAQQLANTFEGCDFAGFNSNHFDIPFLDEEFSRAGVQFDWSKRRFIDVQTIFHKMEKRDLAAACKFYCGHEMENHHSAMADTQTTYEVLKAQLDRYPQLQNDVEALSAFSSHARGVDLAGRLVLNEQGKEVINFGKYRGRIAEEVLGKDSGYYGWILNTDFPSDTKRAFTRIYMRVKQK